MDSARHFVSSFPGVSSVLAVVSVILFQRFNKDYRSWLSLGPSTANGILGYMLTNALSLLATDDIKSTACYDSTSTPRTSGYLSDEDIPIRHGSAPVISKWVFPVRQLSARADERQVELINEMMREIASKQVDIFVAPSLLEGQHSFALFVKAIDAANDNRNGDGRNKEQRVRQREIFHCHGSEGSSHATLSPADAKLMLDRGWGERHPLSGQYGLLKLEYVMIYSPRNSDEIDVVRKVANAAIQYGLERRRKEEL